MLSSFSQSFSLRERSNEVHVHNSVCCESLLSHSMRESQANSCGLLMSQTKHVLFLFELANENVLYKVNTSS